MSYYEWLTENDLEDTDENYDYFLEVSRNF